MVLIAQILGQCLPFTPFLPVDLSLDSILTHFIVPLVRRDRRIYSWKSGYKGLDSYSQPICVFGPNFGFFLFFCVGFCLVLVLCYLEGVFHVVFCILLLLACV